MIDKTIPESRFKPIKIQEHLGGIALLFKFENGYGASVVKNGMSYGGKHNLWELAVIKYKDEKDEVGEFCYTTPLTEDVIGFLNWHRTDEPSRRVVHRTVEEYLFLISEITEENLKSWGVWKRR